MDELQEIEAIKRLKYQYMRGVDEKLWDEVADTLAEDATCSYNAGKYAFDGREAIMKFLVEAMDRPTLLSSHRINQPEIELIDETHAKGIWALEDTVIDLHFEITLRGAAFYRDDYIKIDGAWKISHTGYIRTFEEIQPRKNQIGLVLSETRWPTKAAEESENKG